MSQKPDDAMRMLAMARPASLDRGSGTSADDILIKAAAGTPAERTTGRSRMRRNLRFAVAATAVAVAAVVLVRSTGTELAVPHSMPARTVLLAAADRIETSTPATGRYWHTVGQSMGTGQEGRAPSGMEPKLVNYRVTCTHELWMARSERDPSWLVVTAQSGKPLSKADEQIWRQQGAYRLGACQGPGVPNVAGELPAAPFAERLDDERHPEVSYPQVGATHVTTEEVMNLPADPARLRKVLQGWARRSGYPLSEELLFAQATSLLSELPTTPKVRAALYRMLAGLSNVRNVGTVTDPLGRTGTGIELSDCMGRQIIIDERSGRLLTVQERSADCSGELTSWTAVTASGWTDARPALPQGRAMPER